MKHVKTAPEAEREDVRIQEFLGMIAPSVMKFETGCFVCGNTYRCVWTPGEYPTPTEEQAILKRLGEKDGVTLKVYTRHVSAAEERKIINNTANEDRLNQSSTSDLQQTVQTENNLQNAAVIVARTHRNREPLLHTAVYMELTTGGYNRLKLLQTEVLTELIRSKLDMDRLPLRQQQGFQCAMPSGRDVFWDRFEWALLASSVADLYPFSYSGRTDPRGFYVGQDKFGSSILVDFDQRADDEANGSILTLGNSGQGRPYLLRLILRSLREARLNVICLDPEMEYEDLINSLGGCFIDLMGGRFLANPLRPEVWDKGEDLEDPNAPETFRVRSRLSQHISFLEDFFRSYRDFTDREVDVAEIMIRRLYARYGLTDETDFQMLGFKDYPTLSELYGLIEAEYKGFDSGERQLYTAELSQNTLLGLHSMYRGLEAKFFNGHTNITNSSFVTFGVEGVLQASRNLRGALLLSTLSFMSSRLLTVGSTAVGLDEFYLFLSNLTTVEYVRNFMKRMRKENSSVILTSQNLEDFNIEGIQEYTKPLFSIPTHQFLFNAGTVDGKFYMDTLQLEAGEFRLIRYPQHGVCLYKCGNERYNLMVTVPDYKAKLFGKADGR